MRQPEAAQVTETVQRITGQPAITLPEFLAEQASVFAAAA